MMRRPCYSAHARSPIAEALDKWTSEISVHSAALKSLFGGYARHLAWTRIKERTEGPLCWDISLAWSFTGPMAMGR